MLFRSESEILRGTTVSPCLGFLFRLAEVRSLSSPPPPPLSLPQRRFDWLTFCPKRHSRMSVSIASTSIAFLRGLPMDPARGPSHPFNNPRPLPRSSCSPTNWRASAGCTKSNADQISAWGGSSRNSPSGGPSQSDCGSTTNKRLSAASTRHPPTTSPPCALAGVSCRMKWDWARR